VYFLKVPAKPEQGSADDAAHKQTSLELQALFKARLRCGSELPKTTDLGKAEISNMLGDLQRPVLVVLDNVWDKRIADSMIFSGMQGTVLVTARKPLQLGSGWQEMKLATDPRLLPELQATARTVFYKKLREMPPELGDPDEQEVGRERRGACGVFHN
jgi:hypothetical protein